MNKARRAALEKIAFEIVALSARLESIRDEGQDYFDNMPESLQSGEKGDRAQGVVADLESAIDNLESAVTEIETASE